MLDDPTLLNRIMTTINRCVKARRQKCGRNRRAENERLIDDSLQSQVEDLVRRPDEFTAELGDSCSNGVHVPAKVGRAQLLDNSTEAFSPTLIRLG